MEKKNVIVGVANQKETSMPVADIVDWEPKKISYVGTTTYFEHDGTFYSIENVDFKSIFGHKLK